MECFETTRKKVNPEQHTNFLLGLFFIYSKDILIHGYNKEITEDDIYEVLPSYKSKTLGDRLEKEWKKLRDSNKASIIRLLWKTYGKEYILIISSLIIPVTTGILQPKILKNFISYFTHNEAINNKTRACFDGLFLIVILFVDSTYSENYTLRIYTFVLKIRAGFTSLIYRKMLKMKSSQHNSASVGKIITLITKDLIEFENITFITSMIQDIVVIFITFYVLFSELGWVFLTLVFVLLIILLPDTCLAIWIRSMKIKSLKIAEKRYQQTKEALSSIKLIKVFVWSDNLQQRTCELRKKEVRLIKRIRLWFWLKYIFSDIMLEISWYCLLMTCIYSGLQLNAGTLFLIMNSLTNLVRAVKLNVPSILHRIATVTAIFKRIEQFLETADKATYAIEDENLELPPKIEFSDLTIYARDEKLIENLNLTISTGVTAITGPVGSGKSVLLKVVAKEHLAVKGNLRANGTVSYASQESWLFPATIKQNILFGEKYDQTRYLKVLRICALLDDLRSFKNRDKTLVADKGENLSKGQQVRINLARAVYKKCDIYLLDDCLSNLDNLVADFIFKECLKKFLANKIVIIVSRCSRHIAEVNNVITLGAKETKFLVRTPKVVTENKTNFTYELQENESEEDETFDENSSLILNHPTSGQLYEERKKIGQVAYEAYKKYVASGSYILFSLLLLLACPSVFLRFTIAKLQSKWVNSEQILLNSTKTKENFEEALQIRHDMIIILPTIVAIMALIIVVQINIYWLFIARSSINLHKILFSKVVHATMEFFNTHLIGSILNRFSEDLLFIDEYLSHSVILVINTTGFMIGFTILTATVKVTFLIPCLISNILLIFLRSFYLKSGRALKRLELSSRSPLIGIINATIDGLSTIKILKQQNILRAEFDKKLDSHISCSYLFLTTLETFCFTVKLFGICLAAYVVVIFMILEKGSSAGDVGLVLVQTIGFVSVQYYGFRCWAEMENGMIAVERTLEYTKEEQECKDGVFVENWPNQGQIKYHKMCFSYNNDADWILNNLDFCIESKEKIAVIGRTGSGKTSMIYTLLRLYDFKGKITIDEIDITTLPLDFYRSQISVIPQDPILFSGTLRENIDPTGNYTDEEIWTTIKTVKLCTVFQSLEDKISQLDSNLSIGQKQLLCLCRVLIRKSKIVVMDELTANVDDEGESLIYDIIEDHFSESTVIMVTHNLRNILSFDKVLVLEKGHVSEFGCPSLLLQNEKGKFYRLYQNSIIL